MKLTGGKSTRAVTKTRTTRNKSNTPKSDKMPKKKRSGNRVLSALVMIVMLGALVFFGGGFLGRNAEEVFPNVTYSGVPLGGLTREGAAEALRVSGYEAAQSNAVAQIVMPNNDVISVSAAQAGLLLTVDEVAKTAYDYGRDGSFIDSCVKVIKGFIGIKTELSDAVGSTSGGEELPAVRSAVAERVSAFNLTLGDDTFSVGEDAITIVKGAGNTLADEDEVYRLVVDTLHSAIAKGGTATAQYTLSEPTEIGTIDLVAIYNTINVAPVEAEYDPETHSATPSVVGVSFDMTLAQTLIDQAESGQQVRIPLIKTEPEKSSDALNSMIFRDVLYERTTNVSGTTNRVTNVTLAAEAVNGTILNPGEEFSFNDTVGQRTEAKGYRSAGAYAGGRTVQEIGGGICQVSSMLYNNALYCDLEITVRRNHQFVVSYLPLGVDATVNWGTQDFKFRNDTDYPIRIDAGVKDRVLTMSFVGTKLNANYIKIEYVTISTRGYEVREVEDESIAPGTRKVDTEGHSAVTVETYKYRYEEDGTLIDKTYVARSAYNAQNRIILVPVGTLNPTPTPDVSETTPTPDAPVETATPEPTDNPYAPPTSEPTAPPPVEVQPTPELPADPFPTE